MTTKNKFKVGEIVVYQRPDFNRYYNRAARVSKDI